MEHSVLSKVGCSNKLIEGKDLKRFHTLPSWLLEYKSQPPVLPWMPATLLLETSTKDQTCGSAAEEIKAGLDKRKYIQADDAPNMDGPVRQGRWHEKKEVRQDTEDEFIGLQTPPHHSEGGKRTLEELVLSTASLTALQGEGQNFNTSMKATRVGLEQKVEQQSPLPSEGEGSLTYALAVSFREAWLDRQPTLEDLHNFSTLPDTCAFLKLLKPWEMKDETLLGLTKIFIKNDSGFAWSAKILSYCLLPKMLQLEQPASRFLVSAGIEAAKLHPRAVVDALLVPLVLSEKGPTKAQCDVINRMLKECLSDDHALSFCAKIFLSNRRQQLPFENPPLAQKDFLSKSLVWSEPAWTILQNILSRSILLDEELLEVLVNGCGEEVARFAKSLKFSNLLLCLLSRLGLRLKPYKSTFQRIAEQTETFMTKSLIVKSASL